MGQFHGLGDGIFPSATGTAPGTLPKGWAGTAAVPSAAQAGTGPWEAHRDAQNYPALASGHGFNAVNVDNQGAL